MPMVMCVCSSGWLVEQQQPDLYSQKLWDHFCEIVSFYLERFQRYGVLKIVQLFGANL